MKYGYIRVSTHGQAINGNSLQDQREKLLADGVPDSNIAVDVFTGTKMDRPGFDELMKRLQTGDELVVCKLDRFARTAGEGSQVVRSLVDRGVRVHILNMGVADNSPMGRLMVTVLLAFAEYERDQIVERTQSGKAIAKQRPGYTEGRPRAQIDEDLFEQLAKRVQAGILPQSIASEELHISPATFNRRYTEWRMTKESRVMPTN